MLVRFVLCALPCAFAFAPGRARWAAAREVRAFSSFEEYKKSRPDLFPDAAAGASAAAAPAPAAAAPAPAGRKRDYVKLKVAELKDLLRGRGLKVSGKKAELVERLEASEED